MPTELAASAYGHAFAVLGDRAAATTAAITAVRRGGGWDVAVLAHARHESLEAAKQLTPARPAPVPVADLTEVARQLAATRAPVERAVADLDTRHGLDRAGLARVLGLTPSDAAARASAVADAWERELDPALLAWLGPGDCAELTAILADRSLGRRLSAGDGADERPGSEPTPGQPGTEDPSSEIEPPVVAAAVAATPAIAAHVERCEVCTDRRRAMVSVRSLLAQIPLEEPPTAVVDAALSARRRPAAPPPPLVPRRGVRVPRWAAAAIAVVVGVAAAGAAAALSGDGGDTRGDRVDELTQVRESGSALVVTPSELGPSNADLSISNTSNRALDWRLATDASWLEMAPSAGRLAPGATTQVRVRLLDKAPEGDLKATITVTGSDGSTAGATYAGTLERPPEVSASQKDCLASASVEDDGRVQTVTLKWEGAVAGQRTMVLRGDTWVGALPTEDVLLSWHVVAVDDRGNPARSDSQQLPPGACSVNG